MRTTRSNLKSRVPPRENSLFFRRVNGRRRTISKEKGSKSSGFTLLEMLVVLGIVTLLVGLSWPRLMSPWGRTKLTDAAGKVRVALDKARVEAMRTGQPQRFRYRPGGNQYEIRPVPLDVESRDELDDEDNKCLYDLQHEIVFLDPASSLSDALSENNVASNDEAEGNGWSVPVYFFPNGRSSSTQIQLADQTGQFVAISLRGLTGTAHLGKLQYSCDEAAGSDEAANGTEPETDDRPSE